MSRDFSVLSASVQQLAGRLRAREISPVELVETHIERLLAVDRVLNGLAAERFDCARREAVRAEAILAQKNGDPLPPLFGVPCTVKEFISVEGMPHTAGLLARRGMRAQEDATVVQRVRAAGAIVLGVTNVPEGGMWMETDNKIYGRTNNPWNLKRTSGGSSGGEAALIACGASPFGLGSDVAGSIRIPAAFCGVVGHKPTGRLVPNTGHWGPKNSATGPYLVTGPIARYVRDLPLLLSLLRGSDGHDSATRAFETPAWSTGDLSRVVVYPVPSLGHTRVRGSMRRAIHGVAEALRMRGATIRSLRSKTFHRAFSVWAMAMSDAMADESALSFAELLGDGKKIALGREVARTLVGRSRLTLPALGLAILDDLTNRLPSSLTASLPRPAQLQLELEEILGPNGVILIPPYPRPAPRHSHALLTPFDFIGTGVFNVIEFPVTQVPTGFDRSGLPVGVQVAAARGNDHLTMAVAQAIEEDFGGWVMAEPT